MAVSVRLGRNPENPKVKVMAGLPSYDGTRWNGSAIGSLQRAGVDTYEESRSLLANVFNRCWVEALNRRAASVPVTHFLLLHADVVPVEPDWFQQLWEEFERNACKVLSVVVPIKTDVGLTSTAFEAASRWRPRRLTVREILDRPITWTEPHLLVNTGLMLVDFREPWVEKVCFTINDQIRQVNGLWVCDVEPEDWNFSRQCRRLGVPLHVTRRVAVLHVGHNVWRNDRKWGVETDPTHRPGE